MRFADGSDWEGSEVDAQVPLRIEADGRAEGPAAYPWGCPK